MSRSGLSHGSHRLWTPGGFLGGQTALYMETPLGALLPDRGVVSELGGGVTPNCCNHITTLARLLQVRP